MTKITLTEKDKNIVSSLGTPVASGTLRYVLELRNLDEEIHFTNPKDAGTQWGDQKLKGDGNDILLLNGLSEKEVKMLDIYLASFETQKKKTAEEMNATEVKDLLSFLEEHSYNDRYRSDRAYKEASLIPTEGRMYRRNNDECRAVVIPKGTTYSDGEKTQQANVEGALFVVDKKGGARITNVPEDYKPTKKDATISSYADVIQIMKNMQKTR